MSVFAVLIFGIGLTFTRAGSKNGQAFFEAGGETPWWINGLSLFISYFSAGTFVVWGSIAYKFGLVSNMIQLTMAISGLLVAIFIAGKWKKTKVKTAAEYIGKRFGPGSKQFYTYLILALSLFTTASVLYPVGKMVQVSTPFDLNSCIIGIGLIIVLYTAAGGLWAVLVTDVVQFVILSASVVIVIPIAFTQIGGVHNLIDKAPADFFKPFNADYTFGFMLAFIVYQTVYIGGNWSYVQRYTSVATERNAKKVAWIFTGLYLISPLIWMLPPMIYRIINPNLHGLEPEGAYMMLCQRVMPAGLIGLVLAGMISATSSKANTTINLAATVFATDLYKNLMRPKASEKEVILIARLFTLLFGIGTIIFAILIPRAGGIVEVVLSIASIAGGALFAPIVWSLFSRYQTSLSVIMATIISLLINLFFKVISPVALQIKFNRTVETMLGVGLPILILGLFEIYYRNKGQIAYGALLIEQEILADDAVAESATHHKEAERQNIFGISVIGISIGVVGFGIMVLGYIAPKYSAIVVTVGAVIFISSYFIWRLSKNRQRILDQCK
ncbi:sodium:solute symporter family protein [Mucilaginibacter gracilis]|nr:sodium:solute symporter family protein [Mucilaginibacter gracilis]